MWVDHLVDVASLRRDVRVCEFLIVLGDQLLAAPVGIRGLRQGLAVENVDCTLRAHHRDLCRWPCEIHICAEMLRTHHDVGATVSLAGDDRDGGHCRLGVGED